MFFEMPLSFDCIECPAYRMDVVALPTGNDIWARFLTEWHRRICDMNCRMCEPILHSGDGHGSADSGTRGHGNPKPLP